MEMYNTVILLPAHLGTRVPSKICRITLFILSCVSRHARRYANQDPHVIAAVSTTNGW